jgi:hypothetical protein
MKQTINLKIELPPPANIDSAFIFGLHKSGSTLLNKVFQDIAREKNIPIVSLEDQLFGMGIRPIDVLPTIEKFFCPRGYFYTGFRNFWCKDLDFDFAKVKNILLVRDPRDALISYYFSDKYSHPIPTEGKIKANLESNRETLQSLNNPDSDYNYIEKKISWLKGNIKIYINRLPKESTRIYRYEDIIFKKEEWIKDMLSFLDIRIADEDVHKIACTHDILPRVEQKHKHIRQVVPGNYKKYLREETIKKINAEIKDILEYFDYATVPHYNSM